MARREAEPGSGKKGANWGEWKLSRPWYLFPVDFSMIFEKNHRIYIIDQCIIILF